MANLAEVLRKEGKYSEAEAFYRLAEQVCSHSETEECRNSAPMWNAECVLYIDEHKYDDAERFCQMATEISERTSDPHQALFLATRYPIFMAKGQFHNAELSIQQSLSVVEKLARPESATDSMSLAKLLSSLGEVYLKEGRVTEAEPLFERSLKLRKTHEDCSNPLEEAKVLHDYATVLRKLNKLSDAELVEERASALTSAADKPHTQE